MAAHLIKKQEFNIYIKRGINELSIQESISRINQNRLIPVMEGVLNHYGFNGSYIRLNKLELDLGILPLQNLEDVFKIEFEETLINKLKQTITELPSSQKTIDNVLTIGQKVRSISLSQRNRDILIFFLTTGYLPWWIRSGEHDLNSLFLKVLEADAKPLIEAIAGSWDDRLRERLFNQFNAEVHFFLAEKINGIVFGTNNSIRLLSAYPLPLVVRSIIESYMELPVNSASNKSFCYVFVDKLLGYQSATVRFNMEHVLYFLEIQSVKKSIIDKVTKSILSSDKKDDLHRKEILVHNKGRLHEGVSVIREVDENQSIDKLIYCSKGKKNLGRDLRKPNNITELVPDDDKTNEKVLNKKEIDITDGIAVSNAGLVLLCPLLKQLFDQQQMLNENKFISKAIQERAVLLTQYLVKGMNDFPEYELVLNKLICGWPLEGSLKNSLALKKRDRAMCDTFLKDTITQWKGIGKVSVPGFRQSFLQREGMITQNESGMQLCVEKKSYDILLKNIPWSYHIIMLKWMNKPLFVTW